MSNYAKKCAQLCPNDDVRGRIFAVDNIVEIYIEEHTLSRPGSMVTSWASLRWCSIQRTHHAVTLWFLACS